MAVADGRVRFPVVLRTLDRVLAPLSLPPLPSLSGRRVRLREHRDGDIAARLAHPIDPEEEDGYGSAWRREWDGASHHTQEHLARRVTAPAPGVYTWAIEAAGQCIGNARLAVDPEQWCGTYSIGIFAPDLRGRGLGQEATRLVVDWAFGVLGAHRVQLEVLASNLRAVRCYLACGFRQEGVRREAELYPDGWKDFIVMGVLASELRSAPAVPTLLLSGTVGVGKSTIAAEIVDVLAEAETNSAAIDLDALTWQRPPSSPFNRDLMVENLTRLWPNYQAHGVTRLVLARVVESPDELSSYRTAVPGADITVCRLTAPQQIRIERLRERMPAGPSRDWHEQRTVELEAILQAAAVEDVVVSNDRSPREVARDVLARAGWF